MTELRNQINNIVQDHQECLVLAKSVGSLEVYEGTTATAEDIKEGKTAYSNGERIVGTMMVFDETQIMTYKSLFAKNTAITEINLDCRNGGVLDYIGSNCTSLKTVKLKNTSKVTGLAMAFEADKALESFEMDDGNKLTAINRAFFDCSNLKKVVLPVNSNSNTVNVGYAFSGCALLESIEGLESIKMKDAQYAFSGCKLLKNLPKMSIAYIGYIGASTGMFGACSSLTDDDLNNILEMCISCPDVRSGYKILSDLGITSAQATRCQNLSNYQAFLNAGWTTGF